MNKLFFIFPLLIVLLGDYIFLGTSIEESAYIWYFSFALILSTVISFTALKKSIKIKPFLSSIFGAILKGAILTIPTLLDPIGLDKLASIPVTGGDPFEVLFQGFMLLGSLIFVFFDFISIYMGLNLGVLLNKKIK